MTERKPLSEADRNYVEFQRLLPELLDSHPGQFVVMHEAKVVNFFDTLRDAILFGTAQFGDQKFSVQEITRKSINLGYHAYALDHHPG